MVRYNNTVLLYHISPTIHSHGKPSHSCPPVVVGPFFVASRDIRLLLPPSLSLLMMVLLQPPKYVMDALVSTPHVPPVTIFGGFRLLSLPRRGTRKDGSVWTVFFRQSLQIFVSSHQPFHLGPSQPIYRQIQRAIGRSVQQKIVILVRAIRGEVVLDDVRRGLAGGEPRNAKTRISIPRLPIPCPRRRRNYTPGGPVVESRSPRQRRISKCLDPVLPYFPRGRHGLATASFRKDHLAIGGIDCSWSPQGSLTS
jgi:hypothetical protein